MWCVGIVQFMNNDVYMYELSLHIKLRLIERKFYMCSIQIYRPILLFWSEHDVTTTVESQVVGD